MESLFSLFLVMCLDGDCYAEEIDHDLTLQDCQQQVTAWVDVVGRTEFLDIDCGYNYFKFVESAK